MREELRDTEKTLFKLPLLIQDLRGRYGESKDFKLAVMNSNLQDINKSIAKDDIKSQETVLDVIKLNKAHQGKVWQIFNMGDEDLASRVDSLKDKVENFEKAIEQEMYLEQFDTNYIEEWKHDIIINLYVSDLEKYKDESAFDKAVEQLYDKFEDINRTSVEAHLDKYKQDPAICLADEQGTSLFDH